MDNNTIGNPLLNYPKDCPEVFPPKQGSVYLGICPVFPISKPIQKSIPVILKPAPTPPPPSEYCYPSFFSFTQSAITTNDWRKLESFDVSKYKVYSFAVVNNSANPAEVEVEISPNNTNFFIDLRSELVAGGEMNVLVPKRFLKYVRLVVKSAELNKQAALEIFLQAQC